MMHMTMKYVNVALQQRADVLAGAAGLGHTFCSWHTLDDSFAVFHSNSLAQQDYSSQCVKGNMWDLRGIGPSSRQILTK